MEISENDTFGMRVLCVDDSKTQLDLFRSELESVYTVSCASNYEETIACLAASSPDLVDVFKFCKARFRDIADKYRD